jgi:DNA-directed RNA polymerase subunit RPC12/RpoP
MVRRVSGDPAVGPYAGSPEEAENERRRVERERRWRRFVDAALEFADLGALGAEGDPDVLAFARVCARTMASPEVTARMLDDEGVPRADGRAWTAADVVHGITGLWPPHRRADWPGELGTYPGYLGGLRDDLSPGTVPGRLGSRRFQYRCTRCGALWPTGWPGTRDPRDPDRLRCPDCGNPGYSVGRDAPQIREHGVIDLHWLLFRFAPLDPGPCPLCGTRRELVNAGIADWFVCRPLDWSCPAADARAAATEHAGHYWDALEPARWESEAAHYAYWAAVDLLRVAAETGEMTELPVGAHYESLDGAGEHWVYDEEGWRLAGEI